MKITLNDATSRKTQCHWVGIGGLSILFSYQTPIAFRVCGQYYRRHNNWGPATGRHMRETGVVDWPEIVDEDEFNRKLEVIVATAWRDNIARTLTGMTHEELEHELG